MIELSFVTERSPSSAVIRWFTHSNYSHVDIILSTGCRLGARSDKPVPTSRGYRTGVQIRRPDYAVFERDDRLVLDVPDEMRGLEWLYAQVDKPYDITGLYASFLFDRTDWRVENNWWCSELGMAFVEHCGIKPARIPVNRVTPNDLYLYAGAFAR
jgi:hypothetical protein